MLQCFLIVRDRFATPPDEQPVGFPNLSVARRQMVEGARSLICDDVQHGVLDLSGSIELLDEHRRPLMTVAFRDVVAASLDGAVAVRAWAADHPVI